MHERYRWNVLLLTYICMLAFAFVFQCIPPVLSLIIEEMHISHTQAGLLMSLFALPGIFMSIPGGILFDRYGTRKIALVCFVLMISGTLVVIFGRNFFCLASGRTISGIGALVLAIGLPQFLSQWFNGKELGIAMGIYNTAMPLGSIISFTTLGSLGEKLGWQTSVSVSGLMTLIALAAFLFFYKPPPFLPSKPLKKQGGLLRIKGAGIPIWLVGGAWMWFNAAVISLATFGPDFFSGDKGFSIEFAGFLTSLIMWGSLILSPVVGYFIDRAGFKKTLIAIGGFSLAVVLFFLPYGTVLIGFLMVMIGIAVAVVPAPVFSLPSDIMEPQNLGLGFGIISTCLSIGVVFGPYAVGLVKDYTGSYNMSFKLMACFALASAFTMMLFLFKRSSQ